jgi:hypothetical protein
MHPIARFLLRFIIVPLGVCAALTAGILVILFAHLVAIWTAELNEDQVSFIFVNSPIIIAKLILSMMVVILPMGIGILISEVFAIRSFFYHAVNGALSMALGWTMSANFEPELKHFEDIKFFVAAGFGAGIAYWLVAGWNAGLWIRAPRAPVLQA